MLKSITLTQGGTAPSALSKAPAKGIFKKFRTVEKPSFFLILGFQAVGLTLAIAFILCYLI